MLSVPNLVTKANNLLREIQNQLVRGEGVALPRNPNLSESEQKHLAKRYLDLEAKAIPGIDTFVLNTRYLKYLDLNYLLKFIKEFPETIFDGKILSYLTRTWMKRIRPICYRNTRATSKTCGGL